MKKKRGRKLSRGDVHPETGLVFWGYHPKAKDGQEWITADELQVRRQRMKDAQKRWRDTHHERSLELVRNTKRKARAKAKKVREKRARDRAAAEIKHKLNPEIRRAYVREWSQKNPEKRAAIRAARRARKESQTSPDFDPKIAGAFYAQSRRLAECLGIELHVDHIIPLAKGGMHHHANLQALPAVLNKRKAASRVFHWANGKILRTRCGHAPKVKPSGRSVSP